MPPPLLPRLVLSGAFGQAQTSDINAAKGGLSALCIDAESVIDDLLSAIDSLLAACTEDDELRATVLRNWRATQVHVQTYRWEAGPSLRGRGLYDPHTVSASAETSSVTASASDDPRTRRGSRARRRR